MSKEKIAIPAGNLLTVAATKSIPHLSALKERTLVDRKTLRAINDGKPVKRTTLQSIADKLRVPISYLLASNAADEDAADKDQDIWLTDDWQYQDIKLQKLDGVSLRQLAGETDTREWFLNLELSAELEAVLLKLRKTLDEWFQGTRIGFDPEWAHSEGGDNLLNQIEHLKTSADIDKSIAELAQHKLKIYGGTYVAWRKGWGGENGISCLQYTSRLTAALKITPEDNSTVRVCIGPVPPQKFSESQLVRFDRVEIDGAVVWSHETVSHNLAPMVSE